jgi:hypothetical protein
VLFRLSDEDRKRFGATAPELEWVDWVIGRVTVAEAITLQHAAETGAGLRGYETPNALREALGSNPIDFQAWASAVWLACRHAGLDVSYADAMTFDVGALAYRHTDEEQALIDAQEARDGDEGKGQAPHKRTRSTPSETSAT